MDIKTLARMAGVNPAKRKGRRLPATRPSYAAEVAYRAELLAIVAQLRKAVNEVLLPAVKAEAPNFERTKDDFSALRLMMAFDQMAQRFGGIDRVAMRLAAQAVKRQEDITNRQLATSIAKAMGADSAMTVAFKGVINSLNVRGKVEAATVANVELIKSIPAQFSDKVKGIVLNGAAQGQRFETIARDIQKQLDVAENRAKLIARDQMAKLNSSITEAKQTALGITEYEWSTAGDERVRPEHAANNGRVFKWNDPPDTGHPGEDINCRCIARPIIRFD